jgi:Domain of unknown function (DUF1833)
MTLSLELQRLYSSAPDNTVIMDAVVLSCVAWNESVYVITNVVQDTVKEFPVGTPQVFMPVKLGLSRPKENDSGVVEISIDFETTAALYTLLEESERIQANITATFLVYTEKDSTPASPPLELTLDSVTITEKTVSFTARNYGLVDKAFPYHVVLADSYPGLSR